MNYSNRAIDKKQKLFSSKLRKTRAWLVTVASCALFASALAFGLFYLKETTNSYEKILSESPNISDINVVPETYASVLYYNDNETVITTLTNSDNNRDYIYYHNISSNLINAFIALEDERFYTHFGIDPQNVVQSMFTDFLGGEEEADSTITQQLIKNQIFKGSNEASLKDKFKRQIQEQYLAISLENQLDKNKILEYYLNTINFGNGSYGVQKAADTYFGKDASKLNISEAAVIASVAQSPTLMNPLNHPENNKINRQLTLENMLRLKMISKEQYEDAIADTENVYERILMHYEQADKNLESNNSYFVDALIDQVLDDLVAAGYSSYEASNLLFNKGLNIYTTQDVAIQNILNYEFTREDNFPKIGEGSYYELSSAWALSIYMGGDRWTHYHLDDLLNAYKDFEDTEGLYIHKGPSTGISTLTLSEKDLNDKIDFFIETKMKESKGVSYTESSRIFTREPQAGMVVMEPATGNVVALYGGRGQKLGNLVANRASAVFRQPSSTFKVLAAFLPALDTESATLSSVYDDSYFSYEDLHGNNVLVNNWWGPEYEGLSSIRRGIYHSMNIVATKSLQDVSVNTAMAYLKQMNFSKLDDIGDRSLATALGSISGGVSVLELTSAYSMIANQGKYNSPKLYTKILDHEGNILLEKNDPPVTIIKPTTAYLLTSAMCDTVRMGTATDCQFNDTQFPIAGMAGLSNNANDLWFCGYTPYYCAGIWSGFDNNHPQANTNYQNQLWRTVMEQIHKLNACSPIEFAKPEGITAVSICSKCGNLAVPGLCDKNEFGNLITSEYFITGTEPTEKCNCCLEVTICLDSHDLATPDCPFTKNIVVINKEESALSLENGGTLDTPYTTSNYLKSCTRSHTIYVEPKD